eukprot:5050175-Pleurochrysis_carterae.AAC.1
MAEQQCKRFGAASSAPKLSPRRRSVRTDGCGEGKRSDAAVAGEARVACGGPGADAGERGGGTASDAAARARRGGGRRLARAQGRDAARTGRAAAGGA